MSWEVDQEFEQTQVPARTLRRRATRRFFLWILGTCLLLSISTSYTVSLLHPQPSVYVSTTQAILRIPIPPRASWEWHQTVAQPILEYGWNIILPIPKQRYMVGYMLWNDGTQVAQSGSLNDLLQVGQTFVWREVEYNTFDNEQITMDVSLSQNILVLGLHDAATIDRIFASRPVTATLDITTPYGPSTQSTVAITYQTDYARHR